MNRTLAMQHTARVPTPLCVWCRYTQVLNSILWGQSVTEVDHYDLVVSIYLSIVVNTYKSCVTFLYSSCFYSSTTSPSFSFSLLPLPPSQPPSLPHNLSPSPKPLSLPPSTSLPPSKPLSLPSAPTDKETTTEDWYDSDFKKDRVRESRRGS